MEFERFFKYIYFVILHFIAFSMMYNVNLEMLGYGVGIVLSFITGAFLWSDIYYSPKFNDPVLFVILPSILAGFISLLIFASFLATTNSKYNEKGSKIILTKETRRNLNTFRGLYVGGYLLIAIVSLMFFLLYKNPKTQVFQPFFETPTCILSVAAIVYAIKWILSVGTLGTTASMIYFANLLKKQHTKQLYIPKEDGKEAPSEYPYKYKRTRSTGIIDDIRVFFRNVNLDYVMNYNIGRTDS